jgi:energy-coupling factor transporter ATP-binding protein EcfA2
MISFSNINKQYGKQVLFVDASFQLNPGEKVGLVGPNGSGKTTLFRMVVGEETPDEGAVSVPRKLTIGYFRQDVEECRAVQISQVAKEAVEKRWSVAQIEQRVREMSGIGQTEISREAFAKITWKIIWPCDLAIGSREIIDSEFCALLRSSLFHHRCRFVSFSSGGFALASESLCRGLGSRWFTERFHGNALVTHFQYGQGFCTARQLKDYAVTRCRLHQRAPQR